MQMGQCQTSGINTISWNDDGNIATFILSHFNDSIIAQHNRTQVKAKKLYAQHKTVKITQSFIHPVGNQKLTVTTGMP